MTDALTAVAAEHAGRWKAERGRAPHYATGHEQWWTCLACPLDGCEWHHDDRHDAPSAPAVLEALVREHVAGHDVADVLASLTAARDATAAVNASNDRAWDVVRLRRQEAAEQASTRTRTRWHSSCPPPSSGTPTTRRCATSSTPAPRPPPSEPLRGGRRPAPPRPARAPGAADDRPSDPRHRRGPRPLAGPRVHPARRADRRGRRIELPPLLWTLTTSGAITGEADPVSYSAGEQREAVRRWARLLDVEVDERTDQDGTVHLYAPWKGGTDNLVRGCIRATVRPALDDEDGE